MYHRSSVRRPVDARMGGRRTSVSSEARVGTLPLILFSTSRLTRLANHIFLHLILFSLYQGLSTSDPVIARAVPSRDGGPLPSPTDQHDDRRGRPAPSRLLWRAQSSRPRRGDPRAVLSSGIAPEGSPTGPASRQLEHVTPPRLK